MEKRQILWALVFGSMLAISGCGDDASSNGGSAGSGGSAGADGGAGSGGSAGSGGAPGGNVCDTLCAVCGGVGEDTCRESCQDDGSLEGCPSELAALTSCIEDNGCGIGFLECQDEWTAWGLCLSGMQ